MDFFNYLMVLSSVIIGLGLAHLLQGVAGIAQHPRRETIYWVHLVWVAAIFLRTVFWWWTEFQLSETAAWSFGLYCFVLAYAVLIYLLCALLFPNDLAGYDGFRDYFQSRKGWFFGVALISVAVDVMSSSDGVTPSERISRCALSLVFVLVAKPGMVKARMSLRGLRSLSMA